MVLAADEEMEEVSQLIKHWTKTFPKRLDARFIVVPGRLLKDFEFALYTRRMPPRRLEYAKPREWWGHNEFTMQVSITAW